MKKQNSRKRQQTINRNKRKITLEARRKARRKTLRLQDEKMEKMLKKARNASPEETILL